MSTLKIAVDLGQGACRAATIADDLAERRVDGAGFWAGGDPFARIADTVLRAIGSNRDREVSIGVGMTGVNGRRPEADVLQGMLAAAGLHGRLAVCDDSITAYLGALGERSGAVMVAGTGAVALGVDLAKGTARSDGWGYVLGDRGSGYWIGVKTVRAALRSADRGEFSELRRIVMDRWGDIHEITSRWRESVPTPEEVASIVPAVATVARDGDAIANAIWRRAGSLLGESVADVLRATEMTVAHAPVAGAGGLFAASDLLEPGFSEAVESEFPEAEIIPAAGEPLAGSMVLASSPALPFVLETSITRLRLIGKSTEV